jgi:hypothetical protein
MKEAVTVSEQHVFALVFVWQTSCVTADWWGKDFVHVCCNGTLMKELTIWS